MDSRQKPRIAVTLGDPAGVGAEVALKALADPAVSSLAQWTFIGDSSTLECAGNIVGIQPSRLSAEIEDTQSLPRDTKIEFGRLCAEYGQAAIDSVRLAVNRCMDGRADAMVTAPLNKEAVALTGMRFSGHTEYIAELSGAKDSRMLLASPRLSVVHVTTHIGLRRACDLSIGRIERTIELGWEAMRLLGHDRPRIAVCGLNPHAGEHGLFGQEEVQFITPAIERCRSRGMEVSGPESPDTIFVRATRGSHDLIVAMYHDQGHIPMKLIDFEEAVNISLGIPLLRTSVDHGTAFDIAGRNQANPANMKAAMRMAVAMAANRRATAPVRTVG